MGVLQAAGPPLLLPSAALHARLTQLAGRSSSRTSEALGSLNSEQASATLRAAAAFISGPALMSPAYGACADCRNEKASEDRSAEHAAGMAAGVRQKALAVLNNYCMCLYAKCFVSATCMQLLAMYFCRRRTAWLGLFSRSTCKAS